MWPTLKKQNKKTQSREDLFDSSRTHMGLGEVKYRVAIPAQNRMNPSQRFWRYANDNTKSLSKDNTLEQGRSSWKKVAGQLNTKVEAERRLQIYNTPFSFLSTVGGKTTTFKGAVDEGKPVTKTLLTRVKSAKIMPKRESIENDLGIIDDDKGYDLFNAQVEQHYPAQQQKPYISRPMTSKKGQSPSQHIDWSGLRPMTGKSAIRKIQRQQLISAKDKIDNIKSKASNDTTYYSPVEKIGINMQFSALFRYEHLHQLKEGDSQNQKYMPLQYGIRNLSSNTPNTIDVSSQVPITICLFPEYFDPNPFKSAEIREEYLQRILEEMGGTYDPQYYIKLYKEIQPSKADMKRFMQEMVNIKSETISPYNHTWIETAVQNFDESLVNEEVLRKCIRQIWSGYEFAIREAIINYRLRNSAERKRLGIQYVYKYTNNTEKIVVNGGYSRQIHSGWSEYVDTSRKLLTLSLCKYSQVNLAIKYWFADFAKIKMLEFGLASTLSREGYCMDLDQFLDLQETHFKDRQDILRNVWFRGALCIFFKGKYLQTEKVSPWKNLLLSELEDRRLHYHHETNNYYKNRPVAVICQELYANFLMMKIPLSGPNGQLISIGAGFQSPKSSATHFQRLASSSQQLLSIQLYEIINQNIASFEEFIEAGLASGSPLLRINLSVRNDLLVFNYSRQQLLGLFQKLFNHILMMNFLGNDIIEDVHINPAGGSKYMAYCPYISVKTGNSKQSIKVAWNNTAIFNDRIQTVVAKILTGYDECSSVLRQFEYFQSLVRRPDLVFDFLSNDFDQQGYLYSDFLKHAQLLRDYNSKLNELDDSYSFSLFKVNVAPVKTFLTGKINEMLYLAQKKYKRILFRDILLVEGAANDLNQKLLLCNKTAGELSVAEQLLQTVMTATLPELKESCNRTIKVMLSYIGTMEPASGTMSVLSVIQSKLTYLYKLPQGIKKLIQGIVEQKHAKQRSTLEKGLKSSIQEVDSKITNMRHSINEEIMNFAYLHSKLSYYNDYLGQFEDNMKQIEQNLELLSIDHNLLYREDSAQISNMQKIFDKQSKMGKILVKFWKTVHQFHQYIRTIHKQQVRCLNSSQYESLILNCNRELDLLSGQLPTKSVYPKYLNTFKEQIGPYERAIPLLKLLSTSTLTRAHYSKLPDPKWPTQPIKLLIEQWQQIPNRENSPQLKQIRIVCQASFLQDQVRKTLQQVKQTLSERRLRLGMRKHLEVIEWRQESAELDAISFNVKNATQTVNRILRDSENVMSEEAAELKAQIKGLQTTIEKVRVICDKIANIQKDYISVEGLFTLEDLPHMIEDIEKFRLIQQIWTEVIKVVVQSPGLSELQSKPSLLIHLNKAQELLIEVKSALELSQQKLRETYHRLYFINKELLFDTICSYDPQRTVCAILQCFPTFGDVEIVSGSVVTVGTKQSITLNPSVAVKSRFTQIELWMQQIQTAVRSQLINIFQKMIEQKPVQDPPEQLVILRLWIDFTKSVEQAFGDDHLGVVSEQVKSMMKAKNTANVSVSLLLQRDILDDLRKRQVESVNSLEWIKHPRFYLKEGAKPIAKILDQEYEYGFQYLNSMGLALTSYQIFGSCLVGPTACGKQTIIKNMAALTAQQLWTIHEGDSYDRIESVLKGAIQCKLWLVIPHLTKLSIQAAALIYQHLTVQKLNQGRQGFNCFFTLDEIQIAEIRYEQCIDKLIERPVYLQKPRYSHIIKMYAESFGWPEVAETLEKLIAILEAYGSDCVNMNFIQKLRERLATLEGKETKEVEEDLYSLLEKIFQKRQESKLIKTFFKKIEEPNSMLPVQSGIEQLSTKVNKPIDRPIVYYGRDYVSRKTTKIKNIYGKQTKILFATRLGIDKTIEIISNLSTETVIVFDRSLSLYRSIRQSPVISRVTTIIFEQSTIENYEPVVLMECYLNYMQPIQEQIQIPISISNFKASVHAIQNRLKLQSSLSRVRNQFNCILQGLLTENHDPVCSFIFSMIWSYGRQCSEHHFYEMLREQTSKHRQISSLLAHQDRLQSLVIQQNRLKSINPAPLPVCGGIIEMPSIELAQILNLSNIMGQGIMLQSETFLSSFARKLSSYYISVNKHTSAVTLFNQLESKCFEKTAKMKEYTIKIRGNHRVVIDDLHLAPEEVKDSATQIIIQQSFEEFVTSPKLDMLWILATKAKTVNNSAKMQRLKQRMVVVGISHEVTDTIYSFFSRGVFRDSSSRIIEVSKQLQKQFKFQYPWFCVNGYQLASSIYLNNIADCLPTKQKQHALSFLPKVTFPSTIPSPPVEPPYLHSTETLRAHLQKLSESDQKLYLNHILFTDQLLSSVLTLSRHIIHHQNILIVGGPCSGKSTAVKIAALALNFHLKQGQAGLTPQTCNSAATIRYIREHEIQSQILTHIIKTRQFPNWLANGSNNCKDQNEESAIVIVTVENPMKYCQWLPHMCVVHFSKPTQSNLLQIITSALPQRIKRKSNVESVLEKIGLCKNLFMVVQFCKMFNDIWNKLNRKVEDLTDSADRAKNRIDSVGPTSVQLAQKTLEDLEYKLSGLEDDKRKHETSHTNLSRLLQAQQTKTNTMKQSISAIENRINSIKQNHTQQGVYLQGKISKAQSKISLNADVKMFAKNYVDLVSKLLQKPFETAVQIKSLSKMVLKKQDIQLISECMDNSQNKPSGTTKQLAQLLAAILEYNKFAQKQSEVLQKLQSEQIGLQTSRKQYAEAYSALSDIQASVNQSKKQELVINDRIMAKNKEIQEVNDKIDRIGQLSRQFERYNISNELYEQAKRISATLLGDTLLTVCLLMGYNQTFAKEQIQTQNLQISPTYSFAEIFYSKSKLRKVTTKLGVSAQLLNQVAMVLNNSFCCLLTDKTGNALRQLQDIIVLLNDKENNCETVRLPFDYRFGRDGAIKTMKQELRGESDNKLVFFIQKEGLLSDHRIFRAVKRQYSPILEEAKTLGLSFDTPISVLRNYSILVGLEEVAAIKAIPKQLEPYILRVQFKTTPKEILTEMQNTIISMRQSIMHSSLMILNQSQVELQDNIEQHSNELLLYIKNPSLSLIEYEDVYTIIFGLNDSLFQAKQALQKSNAKLKQKDEEINQKYSKCLQQAMKVQAAYSFLQQIEVQFKALSNVWLDIFAETVKEIKAIDDHVYFGDVLAKELTRGLYELVKEEITDDSKILLLTYVKLILGGTHHNQILKVVKQDAKVEKVLIQGSTKEYLEWKLKLDWSEYVQKCKQLLSSSLSDILKNKMISRKTSSQQDPKGFEYICAKISLKIQDKKKNMIAFILPYPDLNEILFQLQRINNRKFIFYTPNIQEDQHYTTTLRDSWKRGHWLFIFNIHLYTHFLPKLLYFMSSQKSQPHQDFRVWVTMEPQSTNILLSNCCRLVFTPLPFPILIQGQFGGAFNYKMLHRAMKLHESFEQWSSQRWERKFPVVRHNCLRDYAEYIHRHNIHDKGELVKVWMFSFRNLIVSEFDQQRLQCLLENIQYALEDYPITPKIQIQELLKLQSELKTRQNLVGWNKLLKLIKTNISSKKKDRLSLYMSECLKNNCTPINWLALKHGSAVLNQYVHRIISQIKFEIQIKPTGFVVQLENVFSAMTELVTLLADLTTQKEKSLQNTVLKFIAPRHLKQPSEFPTVILPELIRPHMFGKIKFNIELQNTNDNPQSLTRWQTLLSELALLTRRYVQI